jgi:predicted phosphoribosyltransferase
MERYLNRRAAGALLAEDLRGYDGQKGGIVLGLPRGGVLVAADVAAHLHLPLDVLPVRKLAPPGHPEATLGAVAVEGIRVINEKALRHLRISLEELDDITARANDDLASQQRRYRAGRPPLLLRGKTVLLVDDGIATGVTMCAAIRAVRRLGANLVVAAAPVGESGTIRELARWADRVFCGFMPRLFLAVSDWYEDFTPVSDREVESLLLLHGAPSASSN